MCNIRDMRSLVMKQEHDELFEGRFHLAMITHFHEISYVSIE